MRSKQEQPSAERKERIRRSFGRLSRQVGTRDMSWFETPGDVRHGDVRHGVFAGVAGCSFVGGKRRADPPAEPSTCAVASEHRCNSADRFSPRRFLSPLVCATACIAFAELAEYRSADVQGVGVCDLTARCGQRAQGEACPGRRLAGDCNAGALSSSASARGYECTTLQGNHREYRLPGPCSKFLAPLSTLLPRFEG